MRVRTGSTALEERRPVTVLFAAVVGSTQLSAGNDERFREQMAHFYAIAREEVTRFGGAVEKSPILVMGRRLGDTRHVARAEALFSEMGVRATGNLALNLN